MASLPPLFPHFSRNPFPPEREPEPAVRYLQSGREAFALLADHLLAEGRPFFILPAFTCPSVLRVLEERNARFTFADLGDDLAFDPEDLERCLDAAGNAAPVIVATSLFGGPLPDYKKRYPECLVAEDRAQGLLAPDSSADFQFTSFGKGKMVTAWSGGALLDRTGALEERFRALPEEDGFFFDYGKILVMEAVLRYGWALVERSFLNPERGGGSHPATPAPRRMGDRKLRWLRESLATLETGPRTRLSNLYHGMIRDDVRFALPPEVPYLRYPVKKELRGPGVSRMADYRHTYETARKRRGAPLPGGELLAYGCSFLPTHDLVGQGTARQLIEVANG